MSKKLLLTEIFVSFIIHSIFYSLLFLLNEFNSTAYLFGVISSMIFSHICIRLEAKIND